MSQEITEKKYSLDTSVVIKISEAYPIEFFPKVWDVLDRLGKEGKIVIIDMVYKELERKDDFAHKWIKERKASLFKVCGSEVIIKSAEIVASHPKLIDPENEFEQADPFLIAHAILENCVVVTCEKPAVKPIQLSCKKEKIPDVCEIYGVETICSTISDSKVIIEMFESLGLKNFD